MHYLRRFLSNHVLANLTFGLIIVFGALTFMDMPRARDPDINFNYVVITTVLPGAASIDVEKRITDPIEDAISRKVKDLRFVSSTSRDSSSQILLRFNDISDEEFDQHMADLRREVQNVYTDQLPEEASDPEVLEITSSSGYPMATLVISSQSKNDDFRRYVSTMQKEFERIKGVDSATLSGNEDPELHIAFYPERLEGLGITPADLADTIRGYFSDVSMGDIDTDKDKWVIRLEGTSGSLDNIASFPIVGARGVVELGSIVDIYRTSAEPLDLVAYKGQPAVMVSIIKQSDVNVLEVLSDVKRVIEKENQRIEQLGYAIHLIDDQTLSTRKALGLMQNNAIIGLFFVMVVTYLFLGWQMAFLTSIGIPFTLAGTFIVLNNLGISVSNPVLLGVVIALGMIVDDAVVVVEAIYYRLQRGIEAMQAALDSLAEVFAPVLTSVLTTIAVFLPLMLLPGIMGEFMRVTPLVVCVGLAISLFEAFWILPAHVSFLRVSIGEESRTQRARRLSTQFLRHHYSTLLIKAMRRPRTSLSLIVLMPALAVILMLSGAIKVNFFAADPFRVFYINAELPIEASLSESLTIIQEIEQLALTQIDSSELRASVSYSGQMFTETESLFGDNIAQTFISLNPDTDGMRSVYAIADAVKQAVGLRYKTADISVNVIEDGPPIDSPVSLKMRGKEFDQIQRAIDEMLLFMRSDERYENIRLDFKPGSPELVLSLNGDAIKRAGILPSKVTRNLQSYVDGELVTQYQYLGEEVDVRLLAKKGQIDIDTLLQQTVVSEQGKSIAFSELLNAEHGEGYQNIRHYDFQRSIAIAADIDNEKTDAVTANAAVRDFWESISTKHPGVTINTAGRLDDIQESLDGMSSLFLMGIGLIYLILGTQFKSYFQPVLVLCSIPLAFSGVVFGLTLTGNPMSLYTLYGVVALAGISVNAAIVLVSAANARIENGMSALHATVFAARRRVIPVLITSFTTIGGLFSLAAGFAGKSLVWGPVATAIVSGLFFSTVLILIAIPILYVVTAKYKYN